MRPSCYWSWISSSHCQSSCGSTRRSAEWIRRLLWQCYDEIMISNRTDVLKTDINLCFTITNCRIAGSRSLTRRLNFKFLCLSAYWQKKLANECGWISAAFVKKAFHKIFPCAVGFVTFPLATSRIIAKGSKISLSLRPWEIMIFNLWQV